MTTEVKLLLLDDERAYSEALQRALQRIESQWRIDRVATPEEALHAAETSTYDVVAIDWELKQPGVSGLDVCKKLREDHPAASLVMLTIHEEHDYRLAAIAAGADDHIGKSAGLREICTRLKLAVNRGPVGRRVLQRGPLQLDLERNLLTVPNTRVDLSKHQWAIIVLLAQRDGAAVSYTELCRTTGIQPSPSHKNLTNEIHRLRQRLDEAKSGAGNLIVTVRGVGYALRDFELEK